jgi:tetratricopeptide (TPR) repeat protein
VPDVTDQLARLKAALVERYRVERELGHGGMATVWLAHDLKHDRPVALKVLRPELATALGPERFLREVRITARLNHPHILPLLESGEADGIVFYAMPFVEGESLRERLAKEKQLPLDDALQITREVADALSYAHDHGVVHRDIKPENILLESGHAVVADFGIARAITAAGGGRLTETGIAMGTPAYMSPEQAVGSKELDGRSDLYSLAAVLYEMLAGEPPHTGASAQAVIAKLLTERPMGLRVVRDTVPVEIEGAVAKALSKTPADRFASLGSFAAALTPPGVPPTRSARTRATESRKVWIAVAVSSVLVALAVALLRPRVKEPDSNRILVVAFTDESGVEDSKAFGRMAQDYIIQVLTDAQFAEVVDPLTALAVSQNVATAGTAGLGDLRKLTDEGQAGTVVSGRYYTSGDSVHVQARITDTRNGRLLATVGPLDGSLHALSELVTRLGREVAAALAPLLNKDLSSFELKARPATYEAFEAYLDGLQAYLRDGAVQAAGDFERAVAADSSFARARLWAAQAHFLLAAGQDGWSHQAKAESLIAPLVKSRGQLSRYENCRLDFVIALGQWSSVSTGYNAARCMVEAAPGSDDAKREVALFLLYLNRPAQGIKVLRELNPDRGLMKQWAEDYWGNLAAAYYMAGDYEGELTVSRQARQRFPERVWPLANEVQALSALGRMEDVGATLQTMRSLSGPDLGNWLGSVAVWLRTSGHRDAAGRVLVEAIAWCRSQPNVTETLRPLLAKLLYQAERWDDALQMYTQLAEEHPQILSYREALGRLAARRGDREEALRISEQLGSMRLTPLEKLSAIWARADIAVLLGDREEAMTLLHWLDNASLNPWWRYDMDLESLHDYGPFQELIKPRD